jgi:hypothetical protein
MQTTFTLLDGIEPHDLPARIDGARVLLDVDAFREHFGWQLKPEGLCRDDICIPVRDRDALLVDGGLDLETLADLLGRPLALDVDERTAALGTPHTSRAAEMASLAAPDFTLPDIHGRMHTLSDHRGKKVLLIAYASW